MTLHGVIFYVLAAVIISATALAITRSNLVHAVVYLIISFLGTALLFYLLGAPMLAALEVIIYAGGIMVLFLFIIMTLRFQTAATEGEVPEHWFFPVIVGTLSLSVIIALLFTDPESGTAVMAAMATPFEFGHFVFKTYWFAVEVVSFLLFVALVGALYLGRDKGRRLTSQHKEKA